MVEQHRVNPPKTPLKRVSRNSLRSLALSGPYPPSYDIDDQGQGQSSSQNPLPVSDPAIHLAHLTPLFADLSGAMSDLHVNMSNLDLVCQDLDGFNEAFAAYIYGLRMNAYITDFDEAPKLQSFRMAQARREQEHQHNLRQEQAEQEAKNQSNLNAKTDESSQIDSDDSMMTDRSKTRKLLPEASTSSGNLPNRRTQTKSNPSSKTTESKSKSFTKASKSQQKQLLKYTEQVLISLPLKFREQQPHRQEMELVISLLKLNPNGLLIKDIVKLEPSLAMHRARDCVTSLVAAKKAVKLNKDGILYRLVAN